MFELWHYGEISVSEAQLGQFYGRLSQTIAWCTKQAVPDDPCGSLRSLELRPPVLHSGRADGVRHVGVEANEHWVLCF
jgi:hypothetical protein